MDANQLVFDDQDPQCLHTDIDSILIMDCLNIRDTTLSELLRSYTLSEHEQLFEVKHSNFTDH